MSNFIAWEHEYYLDRDGSRQRVWFVTYKAWYEYRQDLQGIDNVKITHIESRKLTYMGNKK